MKNGIMVNNVNRLDFTPNNLNPPPEFKNLNLSSSFYDNF